MTLSGSCSNSTPSLRIACSLPLLVLAGCVQAARMDVPGAEPLMALPVAVLPVQNLSGTSIPAEEIHDSLTAGLRARGMAVLENDLLEQFMARHRMRYLGGIDRDQARAFLEETGVGAVMVTSADLYSRLAPPQMALTSRLVTTGAAPMILAIESATLAGNDEPGLLGVGIIEDPAVLREEVVARLLRSYDRSFGEEEGDAAGLEGPASGWFTGRFVPKITYRPVRGEERERYRVAVLPFRNESEHAHAGAVLAGNFARQMAAMERYSVIEPGMVRTALLRNRVIMGGGISYDHVASLFADLDADLVVTGTVRVFKTYEQATRAPSVDFSTMIFDRDAPTNPERTVWASQSFNDGDDGVFFFDVGREGTANSMATRMIRAVARTFVED